MTLWQNVRNSSRAPNHYCLRRGNSTPMAAMPVVFLSAESSTDVARESERRGERERTSAEMKESLDMLSTEREIEYSYDDSPVRPHNNAPVRYMPAI